VIPSHHYYFCRAQVKFENLAQGDEVTGAKGTNSVFVMSHQDIKTIPSNGVVTYARIVVNFCPHKKDPNRVRITAGGNLIDYPGELKTRTNGRSDHFINTME